jgi:aspartyl-tRNA(Asn)/glutamyl-tRNA(Gln) amidotransferase subunit A
MTVPASLAGLPAVSVPAGLAADGWPVGVSVVGQWGSDELVMCVGKVIERTSNEDNSDSNFAFDFAFEAIVDVINELDAT